MSQPGIAPFQRHLHHHRHADVVNDVEAETVQFFQDDLRLRRFKPCERFDLLAVSFKDQAAGRTVPGNRDSAEPNLLYGLMGKGASALNLPFQESDHFQTVTRAMNIIVALAHRENQPYKQDRGGKGETVQIATGGS